MTKSELSKYYHLSMEIKDIEEQIRELEKTLIGSPILTGMPHGSGVSNPVEQKATLLQLTKLENYIFSIEDTDVRLIFTKRYIQFKQWDEIIKEMCMSESSVFRRHREQLKREHK